MESAIAVDRALDNNVEMEGTKAAGAASAGRTEAGKPLRLLFAVPFSPRRDANHGGRVVAQLLLRLTERHRVAVVYLRRPVSPPMEPLLAGRCEVVEEIQLRGAEPIRRRWRHRRDVAAAPFTGIPSPVAPLRNQRFARACLRLLSTWHPDVVQVEHDTIAYFGPLLRASADVPIRVLTCHEPGPLASRDQARRTARRQQLAHRIDALAWDRYWRETLPAFDGIVALTEEDRAQIDAAVPGLHLVRIGLGIDIPDQPLSAIGCGEPTVIFIGGYEHPPNADAALRLVRTIMPMVRRTIPETRLMLVGARPSRELILSAGPHDTVTGTVPSVEPFLDEASILALPIRLGGGMRVKLLEALAAGKAVVASPIAAAGLDVTDGRELCSAVTDAEFADAIVRLIIDPEARARMGAEARRWATSNLSWDQRVAEHERMYSSLIAASGR